MNAVATKRTIMIVYGHTDREGRCSFCMMWWDGYLTPVRGQMFNAQPGYYVDKHKITKDDIWNARPGSNLSLEEGIKKATLEIAKENLAELHRIAAGDLDGSVSTHPYTVQRSKEILAMLETQ